LNLKIFIRGSKPFPHSTILLNTGNQKLILPNGKSSVKNDFQGQFPTEKYEEDKSLHSTKQ
jgi:hypothetical protein